MKDRTEASKLLKEFIVMVHTQFNSKVKVVRNDNGSEFTSGPMKEFYREQGDAPNKMKGWNITSATF